MRSKWHIVRAFVGLALLITASLALLAAPDLPRYAALRQKDEGQGRKEEEEDDPKTRPAKKDVTRFEDPDDKDKPQAPAVTVPTGDLKEAAKVAKHKHVRQLYEDLATAHDRVKFKGAKHVTASGSKIKGGIVWVEPIAEYYASPRDIKARLSLQLLDEKTGKRGDTVEAGAGAIEALHYYEQVAGDLVTAFLKTPFQSFSSDDPLYLTRYNQLVAAETALSRVVAFHDSARKRGARKGDEWEAVGGKLKGQLLGVLIEQMEELTTARSWDAAFTLSKRLIDTYPSKEEHARIAKPLADLLKKSLGDTTASKSRLREARKRLRQIEDRFPDSKIITEISGSLRAQAAALAKKADEIKKDNKEGALALVKQAEEIWPEYPGLRDLRVELEGSYQVLRVGVRALPKYLSPGWAVTDTEQRAVELQFESLVDLVPDGNGALYYRPQLAERRPQIIQLGREMRLPRKAKWSDGKDLTVGDLRYTLRQLQEGRGKDDKSYRCAVTGRCVAWGDLLAGLKVEGDPTRVKLLMHRGLLDPLGAMSFKVLPNRTRPDPAGKEFATLPIGSGPFRYTGRLQSEDGIPYAGFKANDYYSQRLDRVGLPRLSEVRFFALPGYKDADEVAKGAADFVREVKDRHLDLVLDLTGEQAAALKDAGGYVVPVPQPTMPNRRIYFLAVNHRRTDLGLNNADLRIALALAIDREGLLAAHYRKGLNTKAHRPLNGPYPAGSWACDPKLAGDKTADPYDPDKARTKLAQAMKKMGVTEVKLTLKYPAGDPVLKGALTDLCGRVAKAVPALKLDLLERDPHALRNEVEVTPDYELAYYSYAFPDESLWLFPLLGPSARGGGKNFLGYNGPLVREAQKAAGLRDFQQVRDHARQAHRLFVESEMPLVPLWQLAPLYAYRKDDRSELVMPPIDPQKVFTRPQEWRIQAGSK
jgi:ABC-type transport system substrate-binding protein